MAKQTTSTQQSAEAVPPNQTSAPKPPNMPKCSIEVNGEDTYALVLIEPHILRRLQSRYPQNLPDKLWDNVFRPALETSVY